MSEPDTAEQLGIVQDYLAALLRGQTAIYRSQLAILSRLTNIETTENTEMATFQQLQAQVEKTDNVMDGAVVLIGSIAQMLRDAKAAGQNGDQAAADAALDKVISDLDQRTESLAQAMVKNTPVDPNPQPTPANPAPTSSQDGGEGDESTVPTTGEMNQPVPTGPAPGGTEQPEDPSTAGAAQPQDQAINQGSTAGRLTNR